MIRYAARYAGRWLLLVAILIVLGCQPHRVDEAYEPRTERRDLTDAMATLSLDDTEYGRLWLDSVEVAGVYQEIEELPYASSLVFDPMVPEARVLDLRLEEDGTYVFSVDAETGGYFFMDLYRKSRGELVHVATRAEDTPEIVLDLRRAGDYRLVVQPEPLRGGRIELRVERRGEG